MVHGGRGIAVSIACDRQPCAAMHRSNEAAIGVALEAAKRAGWAVAREGGQWVHLCPEHKARSAKAAGRGLL